MKVQCPNCNRILNVAGLYLRSRENDGKIMSNGLQNKQTVTCHDCDTVFVPESYNDGNDKALIESNVRPPV